MIEVEIVFPWCAYLAIVMIILWMLLFLHQEVWLCSGGVVAPSLGLRFARASIITLQPGRSRPVAEMQGTRIKLVQVDAARAEAVPDAMDSLVRRGASIVLGSHGSAISAAAAREATVKKLAFFETGAVGQTAPDDSNATNFFRLAPMGANLGRAAINFVQDELAAKLPARQPLRYGVAYVDDPYGRAVAQGALDTINERALTLAGSHRRCPTRRVVLGRLRRRRRRRAQGAGGRPHAAARRHRHQLELLHAGVW